MSEPAWRKILGDSELAAGVAELLDALDDGDWKARKRIGDTGVSVWPDGERRRVMTITLRVPLNEHKLEFYREMTGLDLGIETEDSEIEEVEEMGEGRES